MTQEEEFAEWLKSGNAASFRVENGTSAIVLVKVPKDDDFSYLYMQSDYYHKGVRRNANFDYGGIYYKGDGKVYDIQSRLKYFIPPILLGNLSSDFAKNITRNVCQKVEQRLGNNKDNLAEKELSENNLVTLRNFEKMYFLNKVRIAFLQGRLSTEIVYECDYRYYDHDEDEILEYIAHPEAVEERLAEQYIAEYQQDILLAFEENEIIKVKLQKLEQMEDSPFHRMRNIQQAVNSSGEKTVVVTIHKDESTFIGKMHTTELSNAPYCDGYSCKSLYPQDRTAFEKLYGYRARIRPEEITDISYRGKSIYSVEPLEAQQSETEGPVLTQ